MQWFGAVILGLVQGLTEFLPISSSAHLRIVGEFLPGGSDPGAAFTAIIQLGTETAVLVYFWRDIVTIVKHWFLALFGKISWGDPNAKLGWYVIIGSLPIVAGGVLFEDAIDSVLRNLWIVASMLIIFAVLLALADNIGEQRKDLVDMNTRDGVLYGAAQALALIPGVSRSGGTITAGLFLGYTRETAARYSFLLAIPAVFGSGLYKLYQALEEPAQTAAVYTMPQTLLAAGIAFCVGYGIIAWFLKYVSQHNYRGFVWYRIVLGIVIYLLLGLGIIHA